MSHMQYVEMMEELVRAMDPLSKIPLAYQQYVVLVWDAGGNNVTLVDPFGILVDDPFGILVVCGLRKFGGSENS